MKIAISGKGGVGKTLLVSALARAFASSGHSVIAIDADPDANLATTLSFPNAEKIVPISEMKALIEERTGTQSSVASPFFKLNPRVDDLPEKYSLKHEGIKLMVMGRLKRGGSGCYCPENALLSALLSHLLIARDDMVILDMAAGIEHLSRGTARSVDRLIIVVEPGRSSLETAFRIAKLARDIDLENISVVANKIHSESEKKYIKAKLTGFELLGFIPYDPALVEADLGNRSLLDSSPGITQAVSQIYQKLILSIGDKSDRSLNPDRLPNNTQAAAIK